MTAIQHAQAKSSHSHRASHCNQPNVPQSVVDERVSNKVLAKRVSIAGLSWAANSRIGRWSQLDLMPPKYNQSPSRRKSGIQQHAVNRSCPSNMCYAAARYESCQRRLKRICFTTSFEPSMSVPMKHANLNILLCHQESEASRGIFSYYPRDK